MEVDMVELVQQSSPEGIHGIHDVGVKDREVATKIGKETYASMAAKNVNFAKNVIRATTLIEEEAQEVASDVVVTEWHISSDSGSLGSNVIDKSQPMKNDAYMASNPEKRFKNWGASVQTPTVVPLGEDSRLSRFAHGHKGKLSVLSAKSNLVGKALNARKTSSFPTCATVGVSDFVATMPVELDKFAGLVEVVVISVIYLLIMIHRG
ncbi:hypothetical protein V6N11_018037 [Hibiscus sabdariffa]|uniref:Uncharacterized protein n=1 Tax=Hibiscus sabdariffa TaxID=183260 RepID=A0ABR2T668_9ROSI